ncbi:hypothetical protein JCM10213_002034 [Rhodosporidiobolus nylandii]
MPPSSFLKQLKVDHCARLVLTADVEFDARDQKLDVTAALSGVPWAGTWTVAVKRNVKGTRLWLSVNHGTVPVGLYGKQLNIRIALEWLSQQGRGTLVDEEVWGLQPLPEMDPQTGKPYEGFRLEPSQETLEAAARASGGLYDVGRHRAYRLTASFEHVQYPSRENLAEGRELARRAAGLNLEQLPHNVRIFFPRAHKDGAELWVKGEILSRSSPYLKDLLASDFAEAQPRRSKRARTSGASEAVPVPVPAQDEKDFDDSDDETDEFLFTKKPPSASFSEADDISFRQITITQSAYSTYHAVLVYLQTGFVHFAPLSSSFPLSNPAHPTRRDYLASKHDEDPSLPLPVSPTSAYRLAHLLQLEDLQKRCLDALRSSLTVGAAAAELFSGTALAYDELRKVILEFVKEKWEKVKETEGWKAEKARIKAGEHPEAAGVLVEVIEAVSSG